MVLSAGLRSHSIKDLALDGNAEGAPVKPPAVFDVNLLGTYILHGLPGALVFHSSGAEKGWDGSRLETAAPLPWFIGRWHIFRLPLQW